MKRSEQQRLEEIAAGTKRQEAIKKFLSSLADTTKGRVLQNREDFRDVLKEGARPAKFRLDVTEFKAILSALSERDEIAEPCRGSHGEIEADSELRDTENAPLDQAITDYFEREVRPYVPDAWINESVRDPQDGEIGKVGYEINFNRYFYKYQPPRPLGEIEADIKAVEQEILSMLREVAA